MLRVLQERKVRPLGSNRDIDSTCGLFPPLTATCQKRWRAGIPRRSLLPPQRCQPENSGSAERTEDIPLLANHLLRQAAEDINRLSARSPPMQ